MQKGLRVGEGGSNTPTQMTGNVSFFRSQTSGSHTLDIENCGSANDNQMGSPRPYSRKGVGTPAVGTRHDGAAIHTYVLNTGHMRSCL